MQPRLSGLRIGYAPYDETLTRPGDKRRFPSYAKRRELKFEIADPRKEYDLLVVSAGSDITTWLKYSQRQAKIIFDSVDSYLAIPKLQIKGLLRGSAKFIFGESRHLVLSYRKALEDICRKSDAVVCSTLEQKQDISRLCSDVHIILDLHEDYTRAVKTDYSTGEVFNFVWEGLPLIVESFFEIRSELRALQKKRKFALHLVTAAQYGRFLSGGKIWKGSTIDLIAGMFDRVYLYSWNELTAAKIIASCDLALIPIPLGDPLYAGKPENKLLIFWRMGVPTLVSATPAYSRVMEQSGINMTARNPQEWLAKLEHYMSNEEARRDAGERGKLFVEQHYSFEKILSQWDGVLESVMGLRAVGA